MGAATMMGRAGKVALGLSGKNTFGPSITEDHCGSKRYSESECKLGLTGADVKCNAGWRSGATLSARFRNSEVHHMWLIWSPINSPTSTGMDSSSSGGRDSGESTSPMLVNTVRYHGIARRSLCNI